MDQIFQRHDSSQSQRGLVQHTSSFLHTVDFQNWRSSGICEPHEHSPTIGHQRDKEEWIMDELFQL